MTFYSTTNLTLFYDGIIAIILAAVPLYFVYALRVRKDPKGKAKSTGGFGAVLAVLWVIVVYGAFVESRILTVRSQDIRIGKGERQLKVVLVSDTHLGQYRHADWMRTVVKKINALEPDAVLFAGDLVSTEGGFGSLTPLRELEAPAYAVLGNWDYSVGAVEVRKAIESQGVEVLTNESVSIGREDAPFWIAGLDDVRYGTPDIDKAMAGIPGGAPFAVLVHNPDAVSLAEARGANLVLAGHTHGGQVRLPWWGAVPRLPITIGQSYDEGRFDVGPTQLFITSGVGESGARARLFNPPEIALLTITY